MARAAVQVVALVRAARSSSRDALAPFEQPSLAYGEPSQANEAARAAIEVAALGQAASHTRRRRHGGKRDWGEEDGKDLDRPDAVPRNSSSG